MALIVFNNIRIKNKAIQVSRANEIRRKISRDLHDEIGAGLTSITMMCQSSQGEKNRAPAPKRFGAGTWPIKSPPNRAPERKAQ